MLPILVVYIVQCQVSLNRINKFINSEELDPEAVSHEKANEAMVKAVDATFTWGEQMQPAIGKKHVFLKTKQIFYFTEKNCCCFFVK